MTLPLRKKLPITVQNIRSRVKALRRLARRGVFAAALVAGSAASLPAQTSNSQYRTSQYPNSQGYTSQNSAAQPSNWQPSRLPAAGSMQPLSQASRSPSSGAQAGRSQSLPSSSPSNAAGTDNSGVVLRWRESPRLSGRAQTPVSHLNQAAAALDQPTTAVGSRAQVALNASSTSTEDISNSAWSANPLRDSGAAQPATRQTHAATTAVATRPHGSSRAEQGVVRAAAYQVPTSTLDPFGDGGNAQPPASLPQAQAQPMPNDPLSQPELAPPPPSSLPSPGAGQPQADASQFSAPQLGSPQLGTPQPAIMPELNDTDDLMPAAPGQGSQVGGAQQGEAASPFDRAAPQRSAGSPSDLDQETADAVNQLERRRGNESVNCEYFRDRLRNATLDKINLRSGPRYGQGLGGTPEQSEKMRLDFAAGAEEREWCDRAGHALVRGRMVDLYNELVVLDIGGSRREIPLRDLCDVDLAYIGKAWNLPVSCGSGHDMYAGRGFAPSALQWKASGLCHKPLYFEEVQLERYGHEVGPILQPLISTAHFFGNIAVLPYKMGIHPPHECQYALGYYRPGDCAPYMLPPIPFSLRGAAAEAGVVVGAAALIP